MGRPIKLLFSSSSYECVLCISISYMYDVCVLCNVYVLLNIDITNAIWGICVLFYFSLD